MLLRRSTFALPAPRPRFRARLEPRPVVRKISGNDEVDPHQGRRPSLHR
jgi:hypothetical protein